MSELKQNLEHALIQYELKKDLDSRTSVVEALFELLSQDDTLYICVAGHASLASNLKADDTKAYIETEDGMKIRLETYTDEEEITWQTAYTDKKQAPADQISNVTEMTGRELCEYILTTDNLKGIIFNPWTTPMMLPKEALQRIMMLIR